MDIELAAKIINCKNKILENNAELTAITKDNERLFKSLVAMLNVLPQEKKERYEKELASDNWKKYSKTFPLFDMDSNQAVP
jgi:hypothetical protein